MAGPLRAVIFDLDDTLYDCTGMLVGTSRLRAAQALIEAGLPLTEEEAVGLQRELAEQYGPHSLVFDEIARGYDLDDEAIEKAYRAYNSDEVGDITLFPDVEPTLEFLRGQGVRCFLLTSGVHRRQSAKIKILGLEDAFDEIIITDVDRGEIMSESVRYVLEKYRLRPDEAMIVGDRPHEEIRIGNDLGATTAQVLKGRFSSFEPRDDRERPDYRIAGVFQVPTILRLANVNKPPEALRIVAIGGGTGLPIILEGCKTYCRNLTAIVAVTDSGRSSGRLRDELGILPPGDARNCLIALSEPGQKERLLNQLFQYRFSQGSFDGMSMGNLAIAAMTDIEGSFERGIGVLSRLLNIRGKVVPPTVADCHICAELEDGSIREGEVNVRGPDKPPIRRIYLKQEAPPACQAAVEDILAADIVVIGPGSLFTSVLANVLVPGIRDALAQTGALKIYVGNIVTQPGQTDGFNASDHLRSVLQHIGPDGLDCAVFNSRFPSDAMLERYRSEGAEIVALDPALHELGVRVVEADLVEDLDGTRVLWEKQDLLRHHPDKLADTICRVYGELEPGAA
ncbi:MAG: uridine diphosphate-N-acetylglucosamine-binding protein YvcK [Candidatus Brocadiae bacterium]|nr:uridine diphosphate-N-acetylglucosamine-binding protein YvcK [Candidatus Brocadiia bacterium]